MSNAGVNIQVADQDDVGSSQQFVREPGRVDGIRLTPLYFPSVRGRTTQTNPLQNTFDNLKNTVIDVEFSEPLNPATVTPANFFVSLYETNTPIAGSLTLRNGDRTIHFVPENLLQIGAYYYVNVKSGLEDRQGSPVAGIRYYFYVGSSTDTTTPTVVSISPPNGVTGVGVNAVGSIRFSEPVNLTTVNSSTISLNGGDAVPFVLSHSGDNRTVYVTPQAPLPASSTVTLSVINSGENRVEDPAGHAVPAMSTTFTTSALADTSCPGATSAGSSAFFAGSKTASSDACATITP